MLPSLHSCRVRTMRVTAKSSESETTKRARRTSRRSIWMTLPLRRSRRIPRNPRNDPQREPRARVGMQKRSHRTLTCCQGTQRPRNEKKRRRRRNGNEDRASMTTCRSRSVTWETGAGLTIISLRKFKPGSTGLQKLSLAPTTILQPTSGALPVPFSRW